MDFRKIGFTTLQDLNTFKDEHHLTKINGRSDAVNPTGYHSVSLRCECYGKFESRGKGVKEIKSKKMDCPFIIHLTHDDENKKLIMDPNTKKSKKKDRISIFDHNDKCIQYHTLQKTGKNFFKQYFLLC